MLDAIIPAIDKVEEYSKSRPDDVLGALRAASDAANAAIEGTRNWVAKRGRASYAGERTIGVLDPGIVAVATMALAVVKKLESAEKLATAPM